MRMPWWALCRPEVHCLYLFHIYTPPSIASAKNRPKMDLFVVGSSLQVRATRGLLFGLIDTMSAVDSGAITPLLRTSGLACCPWAQVNHYVEGSTKSDKRPSITSYHNARPYTYLHQGWRHSNPAQRSVLRGVTPRRLGENVLATEHGKRGTFHADGPYDLLRLLRCDLRCSLSPSAPEGRSGTGAYLWSQV